MDTRAGLKVLEKTLAPAQYLTTSHRMSTSYPRRYKEYHVPTTENQQLGTKSVHVERPNHLRLQENLHHHQQQQQQTLRFKCLHL